MTLNYNYRGLALLALLVVVLPIGAWHFALGDTFATWCDCRQLSARLQTLAPEPAHPTPVVAEGSELILSGGLLDTVRRAAAELPVRVAGYEPLVTAEHDGIAVHTARVTLTGSYPGLLGVVAKLEKSLPGCRFRSLEWHTVAERRTRRPQLLLTLYIQQVTLKK